MLITDENFTYTYSSAKDQAKINDTDSGSLEDTLYRGFGK